MSILEALNKAFVFLRSDGLFIKATMVCDDEILIENTTYITDVDDGKDIDCLCVHEDELGLGGACVCENITTGQWLQEGSDAPRGCVACPVCQRLTRPWAMQKRCHSFTIKVNETSVSLLNSQPNTSLKRTPMEMSEKVIDLCNAIFPEVIYA